eukprot:Nitzschia sp. Nitz4//scaffold146_size56529//18190//19257//NITZ4_006573-RA/size56529-processed-gene-0.50-mRNA-1//1//CDS//3329536626//1614//frame0
MSEEDWCTIESDPGVFTELIEDLGCSQVQLEEVMSLDDDSLQQLLTTAGGHVFGFIFLFQWQSPNGDNNSSSNNAPPPPPTSSKIPLTEDETPPGLFFAHQTTTNACATHAILSVIMNAQDLELGPLLTDFKEFTATFPPPLKGISVGSSEAIKKVHNALGRMSSKLSDGKMRMSKTEGEAFHFVAYVPVNGVVYELDGLQKGPVVVGEYDVPMTNNSEDDDNGGTDNPSSNLSTNLAWMALARTAIQERMNSGSTIQYNLMAVIQDKRITIQQQLEQAQEVSPDVAATLALQLEQEETVRKEWKKENERRRHNYYIPQCANLLFDLARMGRLAGLVEQAQQRKRQKLQEGKTEE